MKKLPFFAAAIACSLTAAHCLSAAEAPPSFMGRWEGKFIDSEKKNGRPELYAEVIGIGGGRYRIQFLPAFFKRADVIKEVEASAAGEKIVFDEDGWKGEIVPGSFTGEVAQPKQPLRKFALAKSSFQSPSLGLRPPEDATVLFDGKNLDAWQNAKDGSAVAWVILPDGALEVTPMKKGFGSGGYGDIRTKEKFGDIRLHLEFRLPYEPNLHWLDRGNSGVFLQGLYEVQIIDSFGQSGLWNECGAIYHTAPPKVNACLPPGRVADLRHPVPGGAFPSGRIARRMPSHHRPTERHPHPIQRSVL